ncbi:MAG TPA: hypothetical protein VLI39_16715 [Sedimentisphaerales bacterium]|nr:hypothetical protein [Sedimentisphaerales bacterium]
MESIHFKEDTAKPENRTNLALLSILQVDEVRTYFLHTLHLPPESLICPSPNLETEEFATSQRPDFVVRRDGQGAIAYIEVELGPENSAQIASYRSLTNREVLSLVGKASYKPSDLSLEAIYEHAVSVQPKYAHRQQSVSLELFCRLVKYYVIDGNFSCSSTRAALSDRMLQSRLVQLIVSHFGEGNILPAGVVMIPGRIKLDTVGENGFSLRVYSTETGSNGVSLMNRSGGREVIEFPSLAKLLKYFPQRKEVCRMYAQLVERLGDKNISTLPEKKRARLPLQTVEGNFTQFAAMIEQLR